MCALVFSCSTDGEADNSEDSMAMEDDDNLVGLWVLTELRIDESVDNDDLDFASGILDFLVATECDLITFDFKADGTVDSESKANYIEVGIGTGGLEIPCPEQSDIETTLWSLDGDQLTFINEI